MGVFLLYYYFLFALFNKVISSKVFSIIVTPYITTEKYKKYKTVLIWPNSINGDSTCLALNCIKPYKLHTQTFSDFRYSVINFSANSLSLVSSMTQLDPLYWISLSLFLMKTKSSLSQITGINLSCWLPVSNAINIVKDIFSSLAKEEKSFIFKLQLEFFITLGLMRELGKKDDTSTLMW